ncbi:dihydrofolate reductase [Paenibacillus macerans]|uniref:Dihydrofolate reductase n=1 Tax=Paenibacillus macerans TaxID=44252 RepID=A0A6N8EYJ0_PAEMA|nr:dihydrofolate reductase [Paenibacillus macerans]MEC0140529.1 dihydrofolate reductase [Paenibacillus macerans]MUG23418.1 dihydrofolate reductase [Paenibacillus macerans]UMV45858.1 dihydrofolate reductase [Paenibacillus macerans]
MSITLIWAMAQNGVIGRNNQLPWRLPADLKFFKAQTMGKTMIMGRKTWESMGSKPLPGRHSVVLTQDTSYRAEGADVVHTLEEALRYEKEGEELMVIGGAGVFRFFLPVADKLLVTRIDEDIEGDVFFPFLNWEDFDLVHEEQGIRDDKNPYDYRFLTYERRK